MRDVPVQHKPAKHTLIQSGVLIGGNEVPSPPERPPGSDWIKVDPAIALPYNEAARSRT